LIKLADKSFSKTNGQNMNSVNLGDQLNRTVCGARSAMFDQGELAQLTYRAFDIAIRTTKATEEEQIEITFPIGYTAHKTALESSRKYRKDELVKIYEFLSIHQLSINAIVQLVTIVETMIGEIVSAIVMRYPEKLGGKRTLSIQTILESASLEEIHVRATDTLLNELSYKSPADFAEFMKQLLSVNLLECPAFHRYMEIKATRDIFIHNRGVANEVYVRKAGTHLRVSSGMTLPMDIGYFLESYEQCLQVADWLERELHGRWHSSEYEDRKKQQLPLQFPPETSRV
jgi:hypothetical protein